MVGIDTFGESAPAGELFKHFGFTIENVVAKVKSVLHKQHKRTDFKNKSPTNDRTSVATH